MLLCGTHVQKQRHPPRDEDGALGPDVRRSSIGRLHRPHFRVSGPNRLGWLHTADSTFLETSLSLVTVGTHMSEALFVGVVIG